MKPAVPHEPDAVAPAQAVSLGQSPVVPIAVTLLGVLLWCIAWYWPTASEIFSIWWRSETFAHGLIVLPVFAWLIWTKRDQIGGLKPRPVLWMLLPVAGAGFLWLLGQLVSVSAAAHAGLVLMIVFGMIGAIGWQLARLLMFPLAFLLFGIPIGDFLLPVLMKFTAEFTVFAVRASGVPVYQEGLQFVVPNGRWSVVEACSGIRYLIASLMVGSLYAYINYASAKKRALFMLVAILVPIFANWLRAYIIVMLGYLSGNELATGVDHLVYGWVFFGVVIMLMFWIGQRWSDPPATAQAPAASLSGASVDRLRLLPIAACIAVFSLLGTRLEVPVTTFDLDYALPAAAQGWVEGDDGAVSYRPHYVGSRGAEVKVYRDASGGEVLLFSALFAEQTEGREMITWGNGLVEPEEKAINVIPEPDTLTSIGKVRAARLITSAERLAVVEWYYAGGQTSSRDWEVKLRLAVQRLLGQGDSSLVFVLATPTSEGDEGFQRISTFLEAHRVGMSQAADAAISRVPR